MTLYEADFLKNSVYDLGIVTEGEIPLKIIMDLVDKNIDIWNKEKVLGQINEKIKSKELKNLVYRDKNEIRVSERYIPEIKDKSLPKYTENDINKKLRIHVILDSFGCPWGKCNFCVHSHFHKGYCQRPVKEIIREIEYMLKQGIGFFRFSGSETPTILGSKIAKEILKKKLKLKYSIGLRAVENISKNKKIFEQTKKDFELMLKSGLIAIFMGGETANDLINKNIMNKGVKKNDIIYTIKAFREAQKKTKILAYASIALIYPTPTLKNIELKDIFEENLALIEEICPDSVIISPATPFKNTNWFNNKADFDFNIPQDFISRFMKYEYVLYKPPMFWPSLGEISLRDLSFKDAIEECERLRKAVEEKGIPTDLTDELFLMIDASGYFGKEGLMKFKKETSIDLISSSYKNLEKITELTNRSSIELARSNFNK